MPEECGGEMGFGKLRWPLSDCECLSSRGAADHRSHSVFGKTKREAQEKIRAALMAGEHGIRPANGRLTVGEWLQEGLSSSVEPRNRPRTVRS